MNALDVLGDPVRRRILDLLARGETSAGELAAAVQEEFGISHPAVSHHLRVLREAGLVTARSEGQRRLYRLRPEPLIELDAWLEPYRQLWNTSLDRLEAHLTEGETRD